MRTPRSPNQRLRMLLAEAGWNGAQLARAVNALGPEQGSHLHYDRTTVAHWLTGSRPRPPVPFLVAEAFTRRLGRPVLTEDTGLTDTEPGLRRRPGALRSDGDGLQHLVHTLHTTGRRDPARVGGYSLAALQSVQWQHGAEPHPTGPSSPDTSIGLDHVRSVRELLDVLAACDAAFGAGMIGPALRSYLSTTLIRWLRSDTTPGVRRELFTVAAQLTYLYAFTCFDMNQHPAAQHFYLVSAKLAREAGDRIGYALALRGLSVQAYTLSHHREALQLAEQALHVSARHTPSPQRAFLLGQLAVTQAAVGDRGYVRHLLAAEHCLEKASNRTTSLGTYHLAALAFQHATAAQHLGDLPEAVNQLANSLQHRPDTERRSHTICLAKLAETHLQLGHLDQACHTWHTFLDLYPTIHSARADDRLHTLIAQLRPHTTNHTAAAVLSRAHTTAKARGSR